MLNCFKPTIQNESIKELVDALNNVKSFQDSDLHLKGFANQLSLIHLKRIILMAYEENEDIELSAAVVKNLNRFLRLQGKFALQILKEAIEETRDTNYFFQIPENDEVYDLQKIQMGLHIKHVMHLDETKTIYAKLYAVRTVEIFGLKEAIKMTHYVKNQKDRDILLGRLNDVKRLKESGEEFGFGSKFLPVKDRAGSRAVEQVLSESPSHMKALFPLTEYNFDYIRR